MASLYCRFNREVFEKVKYRVNQERLLKWVISRVFLFDIGHTTKLLDSKTYIK